MSRYKSYKIEPERRKSEMTKEWEEILSGKKSSKKKSNGFIPLVIFMGIGATLVLTDEYFASNVYHNLFKNEIVNNLYSPPVKNTDEYTENIPIQPNNKTVNFNSEPSVIPNFTLKINSMEIEDIIDDDSVDKVSIYLDLKNTSSQIQHINYMNFEVYDKFKNKMDYDIKSYTENMLDNNLEIDQQISGKISFKISNKIDQFYLVFKDPNPQNGCIYFTLPRYI